MGQASQDFELGFGAQSVVWKPRQGLCSVKIELRNMSHLPTDSLGEALIYIDRILWVCSSSVGRMKIDPRSARDFESQAIN